jgi:hypothetical protein
MSHRLKVILHIVIYIDNYYNDRASPLNSSGIHFKVDNSWKNNTTLDNRNLEFQESLSVKQISPQKTNSGSNSLRHSYERRTHSPLDRRREREDYGHTLLSQISEKEQRKKKLRDMGKIRRLTITEKYEDSKYLESWYINDPFGKMGSGAPIRDINGHTVAERGNVFDRGPSIDFYQGSPRELYSMKKEVPQFSKSKLGKLEC